jgi:sugar lactone lactonase YvrE
MNGRTLTRRAMWPAALAAVLTFMTTAPAHAAAATISFNPLAGEFPEGIAIDHHGNTFVSLRTEVREVAADGTQRTIAKSLVPAGEGIGLAGMAFDGPGDLFVTAVTFNPADSGVYEIPPGGTPSRLPGSEQIGLANGLAFDDRGSLYVTDSLQGAVWRLSPEGAERLVQDPLLEGDGSFGVGVPIGANGIAFLHGSLYVTNTELGRVVRIPLSPSGAAGALQLVAEGLQFIGSDGCQFDVHGNLYIALNAQNKLVRLAPDGTLATVATAADGLDFPASPLFGEGSGDRETVFVTNFALGHANPADAHPGVVSFDVGVPGEPLPRAGGF